MGQRYDDDDPSKAAAVTKAALAKNPDLKGIFATNLFSAEGAATGIREAGKLGQVKIVGFDAGPKQIEDLKKGTVQALIAQKPAEIGADGVEQAYNALTGKATEKKIGTGFTSLTKDNLAENPDAPYKASCDLTRRTAAHYACRAAFRTDLTHDRRMTRCDILPGRPSVARGPFRTSSARSASRPTA